LPELPEVEVIARCLKARLSGLTVSAFRVLCPAVLRNTDIIRLGRLKGGTVRDVRRRGKHLLMDTDADGNLGLLFHLKMTGRFVFRRPDQPWEKHTHFGLSFLEIGHQLRYLDVRKFGFIRCVELHGRSFPEELKELGPEPLDIGAAEFAGLLRGRKAVIKSLLLDQKIIAGIGNIYADELLFRARINPLLSVSLLSDGDLERVRISMRQVLREAVARNGSSIRDFTDAEGRRGTFQRFHCVYGREGCPCIVCGRTIERIRVSGRSSHYCPLCQKLPPIISEKIKIG